MSGEIRSGAEARYNANIAKYIYVTGAALFCLVWKVQIHVLYRLRKQQHSVLVKGGKWQDYRDQRSNQSPAVRAESREGGKGGGGGFDGERLLHTAYGTLRCEGGKRQLSIFQSHSC